MLLPSFSPPPLLHSSSARVEFPSIHSTFSLSLFRFSLTLQISDPEKKREKISIRNYYRNFFFPPFFLLFFSMKDEEPSQGGKEAGAPSPPPSELGDLSQSLTSDPKFSGETFVTGEKGEKEGGRKEGYLRLGVRKKRKVEKGNRCISHSLPS